MEQRPTDLTKPPHQPRTFGFVHNMTTLCYMHELFELPPAIPSTRAPLSMPTRHVQLPISTLGFYFSQPCCKEPVIAHSLGLATTGQAGSPNGGGRYLSAMGERKAGIAVHRSRFHSHVPLDFLVRVNLYLLACAF